MNRGRQARVGVSAAALLCCLSTAAFAQPDVIVGELPDFQNNAASGLYDSCAVGTTSCNKGTATLSWVAGNSLHPVICQNLFRLSPDGRFEQIAEAWLKHGFTALTGNACGFGCQNPGTGSLLGIGCSDPYSSNLNNGSSSSSLGPKWQVNPTTGQFPYPFTAGNGGPQRFRPADIQAGSRYFVEGHYIAQDDAGAGNGLNNASWREVSISGAGNTMAGVGSTHREEAAIYAWQDAYPEVVISTVDVPNDGRYILGCRVSGTGPYTYEYALHNLNSNRCAGSFTVPLPGTQPALTAIGFHDVESVGAPYASDPNDLAADDWNVSGGGASATSVVWSGPAHTGNQMTWSGTSNVSATSQGAITGNDLSANVLRWGTMFNFRFTSTAAPANGNVSVGLWRAGQGGDPSSAIIVIPTPGGATAGVVTGSCCNANTCSVTTQTACNSGGGTFLLAGGTCSPDPCAMGSCCTALGACSVTTEDNCTSTWTNGASCSPNQCPQPSGACCVNQVCSISLQAGCSGTWLQLGTCAPDPCILPTGACCAGGLCSTTVQAGCGGAWTNGLSCSPDPCGGNDLCAGAIPLCQGVAANGTNVGVGTEGTASCGSSGSNDVWYTYTPATSATITVNTCTAPATGAFDTILSAYTGSCGALTEVACNDDATSCGTRRSRISFSGTGGTTYYLRVAGWNGATGNFIISATGGNGQGCNTTGRCCTGTSCTVVTQSNCSGSWTASGTCSGNPCDPSGACCAGTNCTSTTQSACMANFIVGGTCSPNSCDPLGRCCVVGLCSTTTESACQAGGWSAGSCTPNPCPPQTDNCAERAGVSIGSTPFDTTNATTDGPAHAACNFFSNNEIRKDVWFNLPCTWNGTATIDTCGSAFDTKIAVYDGYGCLDYETRLLACNDDNTAASPAGCGGGSLQSSITIPVVCGQHYTIRIGGYTSAQGVTASGVGVLNITATPDPSGACCSADGTCTQTYPSCCTGAFNSGGTCTPNNCPQPTGACCDASTGGCSVESAADCSNAGGHYQGDSSACSPNPCPQVAGACCCGSNCVMTLPGDCTGSDQAFSGPGTGCAPYSNSVPCCRGDYNKSGAIGVQDIFDFLAGYFSGSQCSDSNDSGGANSPQDIFDFLAAYFNGGCP